MANQSKPNPYHGMSRRELHKATQQRVQDLMYPSGPRTPEERAALALDTAHLLIILARHVSANEFAAEGPQKSMRDGMPLAQAFAEHYEKVAQSERYAVFVEAADIAVGERQQRSVGDSDIVRELYRPAVESDAGLMAALAKFQEMHGRKKRR